MNNKTLGERIKYHRKRLGLTQEELAQRMGVSAQAVSKWENNLSCPDISILPELAEVFDISLDELLGRENTQTVVHEAEPVKEEKKKEFHWEWQHPRHKLCGILFAVFVLLYGGLLLTNNVLDIDVSWWTLLWTMGLAYIGACGLCYNFSFFCLIMVLAGGFFLLDAYELFSFDLGWGVLIPAVLIIWGISLLIDLLLGKKKKKRAGIHFSTGDGEDPRCEYSCDDGWLKCEQSFGEYRVPVVTPLLRGGEIESNFGNFYVDFSGCEALASDCRVNVENNFGSLTILVPDKFMVSVTSDNTFATSAEVKGQPIDNPKGTLHLEVENNFGHVNIKYV